MNDRYTFRGYSPNMSAESKHETGWIYGYLENVHYARICKDGSWYYVDENTIGQCTDIKDISGKMIYEGDIIKISRDSYHDVTAVVEWRYDGFIANNIEDNPKFLMDWLMEYKSARNYRQHL